MLPIRRGCLAETVMLSRLRSWIVSPFMQDHNIHPSSEKISMLHRSIMTVRSVVLPTTEIGTVQRLIRSSFLTVSTVSVLPK